MANKKIKVSTAIGVERDWETEDAFRTLIRAEEIKKDKKLMAKVQTYAQEQMKNAACVVADADECC